MSEKHVPKKHAVIDGQSYTVDGRCMGCEWLSCGMVCLFEGDSCDFPWTVQPHECPRCHREIPPQTWCPDCPGAWAWPVGGKQRDDAI